MGLDLQRTLLKGLSRLPQGVLRRMGGEPIVGRGASLDPLMQIIAATGKKQPALTSMRPVEARAALETAAKTLQGDIPRSVRVREDVIPSEAHPLPIRIYEPGAAGDNLPITMFFHFGGFVIGSRNVCDGFCGLLCERAGTRVVNVEYRLAPEHPFPAPVEDALAAYQWALDDAGNPWGDASRIAVAGDSAGGMLAAVIAQEAKRRGWQPPVCQLLIYPWLAPHSGLPSYEDFADAYPLTAEIMAWFSGHYFRSDEDKQHRWAAPLDDPGLPGLPEAIVITAGFDPLRDEGERYAGRLKEAGVPATYRCYEHLPHSFTMFGGVAPAAQRAMIEIGDELARRLLPSRRA